MSRTIAIPRLLRRWSVIVAALILTVTGLLKWNATLMPMNVHVAVQPSPSPNARDGYDAAEALIRDEDAISYAVGSGPLYVNASKTTHANWVEDPKKRPWPLADKDRMVADNLPAIAKLHQAFRWQYLDRPAHSFYDMYPYFSKDRSMARLLSLQGQSYAAHKNYDAAIDAYLDAIELGGNLPRGSSLIGDLVGIACQSVGRRHAGEAVDHLSAAKARSAAFRLAAIDAAMISPADAIRLEKQRTQVSLLELFRHKNWRHDFVTVSDVTDDPQPTTRYRSMVLNLESPRWAFEKYSDYMDRYDSTLRLPWPVQKNARAPMPPHDPVNDVLSPIFSRLVLKHLGSTALNRLLETQIAIRAYQLEHEGRVPDTLAALVPRYLPSVPIDPFASRQPLVYAPFGTEAGTWLYNLYSIGPDAKDDGGSPIVNHNDNKQNKHAIMFDGTETGDIVAGVNR